MTRCTIAIPVYNRPNLVREALESALVQKVAGLEILVVDNHSTDETWEALQAYRDRRVRLVRNDSNLGLFGNFNRCLELAQGDYLRFLCSDDRLTPDCLNDEIRIMDAHPNVVLLSTAGLFIDESGVPKGNLPHLLEPGIYPGLQAIKTWFWLFSHYGYNPLNYPSGVLFRRQAALRAGRFDVSMRLAGDIAFYLRVLEQGDLAVSAKFGCEIRQHPGQEQTSANTDGSGMREHFTNLERCRELLELQGSYQRVRRQLAGVVLSEAYNYWRLGMPAAGRACMQVVQASGVSWIAAGIAFARMCVLRGLLCNAGIKTLRLPAAQPL